MVGTVTLCQARQDTPGITALDRQRQEGYRSKVSMGCTGKLHHKTKCHIIWFLLIVAFPVSGSSNVRNLFLYI